MAKFISMIAVLTALWLAPVAARAQSSPLDFALSSLQAQGYEITDVSRTLLGRVVIEARNDTYFREIVLDPVSGEILRDYWESSVEFENRRDSWIFFLFRPSRGSP